MRGVSFIIAIIALIVCIGVSATEAPAASDDTRIGLSPAAEKKAQLDAKIELYKSVFAGVAEARSSWNEFSSADRNAALAGIAWSKEPSELRERAIRDLARLSTSADSDGSSLKALAGVAVAEGDGSLRALARKALAARDDKRTANLLVTALSFDDALLKANTVEALKEIGGPRVFEVIIEHWHEIWGASPEDHIFVGRQQSYIADYDISGNSYDPIVKTFMTGVVLDAKVLKVEGDTYYVWIRELTGEKKLPNDPAAWQRWVKKNEPQLAKQKEKNKEAALDFFKE